MDAKPNGKSEEIHPTVKKRWIVFFAIVALVAVFAYFAFATYAPVKTGAGPPTEVKTEEALATEQNTNVGQETTVNTKDYSSLQEFYSKNQVMYGSIIGFNSIKLLAYVNNIPKEFLLGENIYLVNLKVEKEEITGTIINRGSQQHIVLLQVGIFEASGVLTYTGGTMTPFIRTGEKVPFKITRKDQLPNNNLGTFVAIGPTIA